MDSVKKDKAQIGPSIWVPTDKKELKEYGRQWHQFIKNMVMTDGGTWRYNWDKDMENFRRYNAEVVQKHNHITEEYGAGKGMPAEFNTFSLGRERIDQILSEYIQSPEERSVAAIDQEAVRKKEEHFLKVEIAKATKEIDEEIAQELGNKNPFRDPEVPDVEDVDKYKQTYRDAVEEMIDDGIQYLHSVKNLREQTLRGLRSLLLTNKEYYECSILNGDPHARALDPRFCFHDLSATEDYLDDCNWFYHWTFKTLAQATDEYRDKLDSKEVEELYELAHENGGDLSQDSVLDSTFIESGSSYFLIREETLYLRCLRKRSFKVYNDKYGRRRTNEVGSEYKPRKGEEKNDRVFDEILKVVILGGEKVVCCEIMKNQFRSIDNPSRTRIPVVGIRLNNTMGTSVSMQDLLNPIEDMHNEVMYHIRRMMQQASGKALIYDLSQIPAQFRKDLNHIAYHMKKDGLVPIDTQQDGASGFNQWKQVDLTLSDSISQLYNMKMLLEKAADDISGVSPQRRGEVGNYEYVRNVQNAVNMSITRTQIYMYPHEQTKKRLYEYLAGMMKLAWKEGKKALLMKGDKGQYLIDILPDIALHDYGFYIKSGFKDREVRQRMEQMMEAYISSSGDPQMIRNFIKMMKADSLDESERILDKGLEMMEKMRQQQMQEQRQMMQEQAQMNAQIKAEELKAKEKELDSREAIAERQVQKDIQVAKIYKDQAEDSANQNLINEVVKNALLANDQASTQSQQQQRPQQSEEANQPVIQP